jgi:hypothetical protein
MTTKQKSAWVRAAAAAAWAALVVLGLASMLGGAAADPDAPRAGGANMTVPPMPGGPVPPQLRTPSCGDDAREARAIQVSLTCDLCEPGSAGVEVLFDRVADAEAFVRRVRVTPAVPLAHRSSR